MDSQRLTIFLLAAIPFSGLAELSAQQLVDQTERLGVRYRRAKSTTIAQRDAMQSLNPIRFEDVPLFPLKADGAPGVSILDYDRDGDLDVFVSNGPGRAHSLFQNQLVETNRFRFVDVAAEAGVAAVDQDGTGSCFGDIDNDGDHDLLVLGRAEQHRLFLNQGDGSFRDISLASGICEGVGAASCAMGDIDNDGLLDIAIAETYDWETFLGIVVVPFELNVHNKLYRNLGGARFEDVSEERGLTDLESGGMPPGEATISWAISMVDYDLDGDVDILHGDDQAAVPGVARGGVDRGYTQLFENDGSGFFVNKTIERGLDITAHWMGFGWADYNCDGGLDFFNTNVGDYIYRVLFEAMPLPYQLGEWPSAWFFRTENGFEFPPMPPHLLASPWGWGSSVLDYDNDGDPDTVYHGGLSMGFIAALDNPGILYENSGDCSGRFDWDREAIARSHTRRGIEGVATGDLNGDGFTDVVSVAGFLVPERARLSFFPGWGSPFDETAYKLDLLTPLNDLPFGPGKEFRWDGIELDEGDLVFEINSASNRNGSITVEVAGSSGVIGEGRVNRDGIGAVITVTPHRGEATRRPVEAGGPYASQDALAKVFGLGQAARANVEILWPGGVKNRLYNVSPGETIVFPEIPVSFADKSLDFKAYREAVRANLTELVEAGAVERKEFNRFWASALLAYLRER